MASGTIESAPHRRLGTVLAVAALVVVLDQVTKWWALNALSDEVIHVVWTLHLALVRNTGAAFSFGTGSGPVIAIVALAIVGLLLWTGRSSSTALGAVALGMIAGGALGNLLDRMFRGPSFLHGGVVDFIDFRWWPVFNLADSAVVVGAVLLLIATWRAGGAEAA